MCPPHLNNKELLQLGDSADVNRPPRKWIPLGRSTVPLSGDSRYLTPLRVYQTALDQWDNRHLSYLSNTTSSLELEADKIVHEKIDVMEFEAERIDPDLDKKIAALKLLTFRNQHVIAQFYSPRLVGKHRFLTTIDQPFGVGVLNEGLRTYRQDSERNSYVLDNDNDEDDRSPVTRVFKRGLPEWTTDINHYTLKQFPQQECANHCNLHGYLGLPVFDSTTTSLCVGVLEVLMSSDG